MARCEAAVRANLRFHTRKGPMPIAELLSSTAEQVVIRFEGRDFVWHPNLEPGPEGQEWWPGLTVVVENADDYREEASSMHRLLSALAFQLRTPLEVLNWGGSGRADALAPPAPRAARRGLGDSVVEAPREVRCADDERLRLALGLYREAVNSESPFYRFLSLWNALDAVRC